MPRSRRFLALASLIAALAWTNAQAMTCCWSLGLMAAVHDAASVSPTVDAGAIEDRNAAHAACHGPTSAATATHEDASPATEQSAAHTSAERGDASTAACCETPAPAESFSALLRLEALPPQAFYTPATAPSGVARTFDTHPLHSPGAPRFLALERLLI
jgi:hypothetical protein